MSTKLLLRRREAADILGFSQSQILKFERQGLLNPIRVSADLRSVRYSATEVEELGKKWITESTQSERNGADAP